MNLQYEEKFLDKENENKKTVYRWRKMLVVVLLDLSTLFVFYGLFASFDIGKSFKNFSFFSKLVDVVLLSWLRCIELVCLMIKPRLETFSAWVVGVSLLLVIAKTILWEDWTRLFGSCIIISQLVVVVTELMLARNYSYKVTLVDGPDAERSNPNEKEFSSWNLIKVLGPYFWPTGLCNRIRVAVTWLCVGASKGSNIMAPLFLGKAVNDLRNGQVDYFSICMYAGLGFCNVFFKQLQNIIYLGVKQTAYAQISQNTFAHLHGLSLEWHLKKKMGNVLRSMDRGVNSANTVVTYLFLYLVPSGVECLTVFIIFYIKYDEPALAVIAFLGLSAYALSTVSITLWRKKFRRATNKHDNALHDKATDSLMNFETVKYFTNEQYEIEDFAESVKQYIKYDVSTQASLGMLNIIQQFFIDVTLASILCLSAYRVAHDEMSVGDFVAINVYIIQLFAPLSFLGTIYNAIIQAFIDMTNLSQLLALEPDVKDVPGATKLQSDPAGCEIKFQDVRFHYPSLPDTTGLQGVSFTVKRGTTTAIVGPTGAGKSTIGRLLFRFYDLKSGQIMIDGQDISKVRQHSLRRTIGVVPQDTVMFNKSVYHNIHYGNLTKTMEDVKEACKAAQIYNFITNLPEKWETKVGERGLKLSGGEKQRVAIARCLLKDPPIVLLDEATSSLDSVTEQNVQKALMRLGKNRTCIVIAHRLSTIAHAEQIIVLKKGRIVERGTHEELMKVEGEYHKLWHTQVQKMEYQDDFKQRVVENIEDSKIEDSNVHGHGHASHHS